MNISRPTSTQKKSVKFSNDDLQGVQIVKKDDKFENNMDVKFLTKGGRQTQSIQIYKNIDALNQDTKNIEGDGGRKTYSMK